MSRQNKTHTFRDGRREYLVELELSGTQNEPTSDCHVTLMQKGNRTDYHASLECADAEGVLRDDRDEEHQLPEGLTERMREWAEANGY